MTDSVAKPNGTCWRCGGTTYDGLAHSCSTNVARHASSNSVPNPEHAADACLTAYQEIIEAWPNDDPCPDPSDTDLRVAFTLAIGPFYDEWTGRVIPNRAADEHFRQMIEGAVERGRLMERQARADATPNRVPDDILTNFKRWEPYMTPAERGAVCAVLFLSAREPSAEDIRRGQELAKEHGW